MAYETHLLDTIRLIHSDRMTGTLQLERGSERIAVRFREGLLDGAGSNIPRLQLGNILAARGAIPSYELPKLLDFVRRKKMLTGKAAVARKLVDKDDLKECVRDQIVQVLSHAIQNDFTIGSFQKTRMDLFAPAGLDCERLFLELARSNVKPPALDPNRAISLSNGHSLSHLPWYPQELSVLSMLKTPCTMQSLAAATGMEYDRLNRILGVFDALKLIRQTDIAFSDSTAIVKREKFPFERLTPELDRSALSDKLETYHCSSSFISEQFRALKVRIAEMSARAPLRVIAISSPHTQDGKSLISTNLAISFSHDTGRKAILVDCDLRNPSVHRLLGASVDPGLLGYLEDDILKPYCYMRRMDKLYVMTAGGPSQSPVELLSEARMKELIEGLKTEFDTIILDCPPFGPIPDAQVLAGLADGLLMVVRRGKTTYGTIEKAFRHLDRSKLMGLVFNDVKPMLFNTQYPYKYYHYRNRESYPYGSIKIVRRPKNYLE